MPAQIEQIVNRSVRAQKTLGLSRRLESAHNSLSDSDWLVREFGSIVGILGSVMNRIRYELAVSNTVTPQFVGDDSPGFTAVRP